MVGNTNQQYIIDASFLLAYLFPDEEIDHVQTFFNQYKKEDMQLIAPLLLPFEILNGLQSGILAKRVDYKLVKELSKKFLKLPIELQEINFLKVLELSSEHKISAYDASYLYLAQANNLPLLTLDKKLKNLSQNNLISL